MYDIRKLKCSVLYFDVPGYERFLKKVTRICAGVTAVMFVFDGTTTYYSYLTVVCVCVCVCVYVYVGVCVGFVVWIISTSKLYYYYFVVCWCVVFFLFIV